MKDYKLLNGDALEQLKRIPKNSVDSVVTDPPAGIGFMGKDWDKDKGGRDEWIKWLSEIMIEVNRVLKPGGHGLVWALPRTSHWTGMALENAGFEVRDVIQYLFGSGFPKSYNIGKGVDKKLGNDREVLGESKKTSFDDWSRFTEKEWKRKDNYITKETSEWEGFGTALKPSSEFWFLIRKPLSEKTIVDNVLKWGVGGLNIDGSRIGYFDKKYFNNIKKGVECGYKQSQKDTTFMASDGEGRTANNLGRFPAHTLHDGSDEVMEEFAKAGTTISKGGGMKDFNKSDLFQGKPSKNKTDSCGFNDEGTPARFFYCSKPSTKERNMGLDGFEDKQRERRDEGQLKFDSPLTRFKIEKNTHPTLKSVKLMNYLINLITPPKGIVLDCFMGSGTTGISALLNGNRFIGIEKEKEYIEISEARIKSYEKYRQFLK